MGPLFKLVEKTFSNEWVHNLLVPGENLVQVSSDVCQTTTATVCYIQQTLLIILEDISTSLNNYLPLKVCFSSCVVGDVYCRSHLFFFSLSLLRGFYCQNFILRIILWQEDVVNEINIKVLVECAHSANDGVTRNHVFSLITSITKITPQKVLEHIEDIFKIIGESAVTQVWLIFPCALLYFNAILINNNMIPLVGSLLWCLTWDLNKLKFVKLGGFIQTIWLC